MVDQLLERTDLETLIPRLCPLEVPHRRAGCATARPVTRVIPIIDAIFNTTCLRQNLRRSARPFVGTDRTGGWLC